MIYVAGWVIWKQHCTDIYILDPLPSWSNPFTKTYPSVAFINLNQIQTHLTQKKNNNKKKNLQSHKSNDYQGNNLKSAEAMSLVN